MSTKSKEISEYPILTMRNSVVFPETIRPLLFSSEESIKSIEEAHSKKSKVFVVTLKDPLKKEETLDDLYDIGVVGQIARLQRLPNDSIQVLFEAEERGRLINVDFDGPYHSGRIQLIHSRESADEELPNLVGALKTEFLKHLEMEKEIGAFQWSGGLDTDSIPAGKFADAIATYLTMTVEEQQDVLTTIDTRERVEKVYALLLKGIKQKEFESNLKKKVEDQIGKKQKEYYLNEQMKAIQEEMGNQPESSEFDELVKKIEEAGMPDSVKEVANKELNKLKTQGNQSHESAPIRNYLDWLVSVPWKANTADNLSIENAQEVLDRDHFGMEKVKERIIEYIAVANVVGSIKGPILCLVGPPGVGKTSLAQSIANSVGRKFARFSLGGIRDEAEIRGHRRTYIGSMPGKIIQTMKKVGTINPLILLDEVDKISQYYMGGPTAALLEVLDPEQNNTFMDHYLEVEYDLSQVMFICTANNLADIPLPLRDRMEIINLSGYTELEKTQIAKKYLVSKQMEKNGVKDSDLVIEEDHLLNIIRSYTREAGVRSLERVIAKICRKVVTEKLKEKLETSIFLDEDKMIDYLGVPIFQYDRIEENNEAGMVTGLAWTSVGGETLSIEATTMKGSGKVQLTGKLGDVMKESAQAAISYVRSNANLLGIYSNVFENLDIHIHVPAGGTPKDGPSAGIALTGAIVSALTGIPIKSDVALTGEVTLRGKVLPIGGLKEKLLAARRAQINHVLIPFENKKDLADVPDEIKDSLEIQSVNHVKEVFPVLLEKMPIPVSDKDLEKQEKDTKNNNDFSIPIANVPRPSSQVVEH